MELIDTDVLIDVQRGFGAAADWFATDPDVGIPGFVVMELVQDARNSDEVQKALALVDGIEVVWPSDAECQTALEQFSKLHLSHGLGLLDALIAATALGHGSVLNGYIVTRLIILIIIKRITRQDTIKKFLTLTTLNGTHNSIII